MTSLFGLDIPGMPERRRSSIGAQVSISAFSHAAIAMVLVALTGRITGPQPAASMPRHPATAAVQLPRLVFLPADGPVVPGAGGGGGGNRQAGAIRHAAGIGRDRVTVRVTKKRSDSLPRRDEAPPRVDALEVPELPSVLMLDAKPLASGTVDIVGLPVGGVPFGVSTGPGSGGGVGDGTGTGTGSGRGPGIGPGVGGGTGGGVYRAGGTVSAPRLISEVRVRYTTEATEQRIQGIVVLELIVGSDGRPGRIRVVRSLDPGLDHEATKAVSQWRFEPGRRSGIPVDVLVTIEVGFTIH